MMQIKQAEFFAVLLMLGFASSTAYPNDEVEHHEFPHHHLALFAGVGFEQDGSGHKENGSAFGLEYELQFHEKWGIGVDVERLFGSGTHRSSVIVIPLNFHPNEEWRFFAGPGIESHDDKNKNLMRVGIAYEFSFHQRWSASPEILVDFVEGGATTYVVGIAIGYGF